MSGNYCCICHDEIITSDRYEIPDCGHDSFHIQCIVQWYRTGENRCPLCNDQGESNQVTVVPAEIIKLARREARKKHADPILKELCDKLIKKERERDGIKKQIMDLKKEEGVFGDMRNRNTKLWSRFNKKMYEIMSIKRSIKIAFPVTNLIIVTRKEINNNK
jgi:hypothetical protein